MAETPPMPTLALIAHDGKKDELVRFVLARKPLLEKFHLVGTGTTGERVAHASGLRVQRMLSGPLGGDAQIASLVAEKKIACVIFFVDPLNAHPHEPDIQGLQRICNVHNVPLATNEATAHLLVTGIAQSMGSPS